MSFWRELRRRNVVKVGAAYAIVAWLLLQIATNAFPALQRLERAAERAERHEPDPQFYWVMSLRANLMADPALERPEFAAVLARIRGD